MNPPPLPVRKRFPWILYWIVLMLIVLVALAPIGSVVACAWIANSHGCKVDEGSVHPCIIGGHDYGELLCSLGVLGWLMLVTLPGGLFAFITWLIVRILHWASYIFAAETADTTARELGSSSIVLDFEQLKH